MIIIKILSKMNSQESVEIPPRDDRLDLSGGSMPVKDCLLNALSLVEVGDFASCIIIVCLKDGFGDFASVSFCWFL